MEIRKNWHGRLSHMLTTMAALLTGDLDEVPITLDPQTVVFASRSLSPRIPLTK